MCFLHYGAPALLGLAVREWLGCHYPGRWIGRGPEAPVSWPPRSPDLKPIDCYLWGSMRQAVYANIVDTRQQLRQRIQDAENEIRTTPGVFERVRTSFRHCADACVHAHGGNFEHLLICVRSKFSLSQAFRISEILEHRNFELLSSVSFYTNTSGPCLLVLLDSRWHTEAPLSFMAHDLETLCICNFYFNIFRDKKLKNRRFYDNIVTTYG
jgi:hypothetical protein